MTAGGRWATASSASRPPGGRGHGEALEAQRALEGLPDGGLVVDDEDQWFRGGGSRAPPRAEVLERVLDLRLVELERLASEAASVVALLLVIGLVVVAQLLQRGLELGLR